MNSVNFRKIISLVLALCLLYHLLFSSGCSSQGAAGGWYRAADRVHHEDVPCGDMEGQTRIEKVVVAERYQVDFPKIEIFFDEVTARRTYGCEQEVIVPVEKRPVGGGREWKGMLLLSGVFLCMASFPLFLTSDTEGNQSSGRYLTAGVLSAGLGTALIAGGLDRRKQPAETDTIRTLQPYRGGITLKESAGSVAESELAREPARSVAFTVTSDAFVLVSGKQEGYEIENRADSEGRAVIEVGQGPEDWLPAAGRSQMQAVLASHRVLAGSPPGVRDAAVTRIIEAAESGGLSSIVQSLTIRIGADSTEVHLPGWRLDDSVVRAVIESVPRAPYVIAVLDLAANNISAEITRGVSDLLSSYLWETGSFRVLERQQIDRVVREISGEEDLALVCDEVSCAVDIGKRLETKRVVIGSVSQFGESITISVRVVNIDTAEVMVARTERVRGGADGIPEAVKLLADYLAAAVL